MKKTLTLIFLSVSIYGSAQQDSIVVKVPFGTNCALPVDSLIFPQRLKDTAVSIRTRVETKADVSHTHAYGSITGTPDLSVYSTITRLQDSTASIRSRIESKVSAIDNTSDANKPVSSATQTALNLKANLASPTFTGTVGGITASMVGLGNVTNESKATMFTSPTFTGTVSGVTPAMVGLGSVNNTSDASKPISTATQTALDLKAPLSSPTFTGTVILPNSTVTNAMLAGSIDLPTKVTGVLPFTSGGGASAATSATTGTITVSMTTRIITCTPTGNMTLNASGGTAGQIITFSFTTSGVTSFTITFGTNFRKTGTLATGTTSARFFTVTFICLDGTIWTEVSRTAVQS